MSHQTDTLTQPIPMPRHTHLLRRGSRYYVNVKVPKDLQSVLKKDIVRRALNTSDPREATRLVRLESLRIHAEFETERARLRGDKSHTGTARILHTVSENEAQSMVRNWFAQLENLSDEWWGSTGIDLSGNELAETLDSLRIDETALTGGASSYLPDDGSHDLRAFLANQKFDCPEHSPAFIKLRPLFRRARLENTRRLMDRLTNQPVQTHDPLFQRAVGPIADRVASITVGDLLRRFSRAQRDVKRSAGTQTTYEIPARILRETLGENASIVEIGTEDIERVCDLLRQFPKNAAQRYRDLTLQQAIAEAKRRGDSQRLGPKTLSNYFNNIVTIFNFAVEKRWLSHNPAKDRWLRETFKHEQNGPKAQFTIDELNKLFRAPLYTGCKNDESGYATPGPNKPRRGRFWVPLLSLFHGLRCNEAAQLYTEDIKELNGIHYLAIREAREDGSKCDKRLKTKQSKRDVPIHPELIRIGFLEFVATRRKGDASPRLFPELSAGSTGYFSNALSKWFARFAETALGYPTDATFHSFRHQFRDATRAARLGVESVGRLAGWEGGDANKQRQVFDYGRGPELLRMLAEDIAKVTYRGLDLSHLYTR